MSDYEYPINPHYDPEKLGLEQLAFYDPGADYSFNTLCFWSIKDAPSLVYSASDSGCSCPVPFEDYMGTNQAEVVNKLERVGSVRQGLELFDSWENYVNRDKIYPLASERLELEDWLTSKGLR